MVFSAAAGKNWRLVPSSETQMAGLGLERTMWAPQHPKTGGSQEGRDSML